MRLALVVMLALGGCFSGRAHECTGSDNVTVLCPAESVCKILGSSGVCATPDQVAQCEGMADATPCAGGACHDGICLVAACGDGRVDPPEQCDTKLTDRCSADCLSDLSCGNGVVDTATGEQCDDGNTDSHDGCDSKCRPEFPRWTSLSPETPAKRVNTALAFDSVRQNVVMFGGQVDQADVDLGDTWIYSQNAWRQVQPISSPLARSHHAMAYDGKTRRVYMFGGEASGGPLGDFWTWDGNSWHFVPPIAGDTHPPALSGAAMAYDAHRQVLVLVGGRTTTGMTGETYEFDGVHWKQIAGATVPPRANHMVVYDPNEEAILLFGGLGPPSPVLGEDAQLDDTYTYQGTKWIDMVPIDRPLKRERGQLGFDGFQVVLAGGFKDSDVAASDDAVYLWVGTDWKQRVASGGPSIWGAGIAFVPGGLVMFGGATFGSGGIVSPFVAHIGPTHLVPFPTDATQTWNGTGWLVTDQSPLKVARGGAALDLDLARPVVFGGIGTPGLFELIDGVWADPNPKGAGLEFEPTPRTSAAAAYDEARRQLVMFGGALPGVNDSGATYAWGIDHNDTSSRRPVWTLVSTSGPRERKDHAMAYDASRKLTILFGGRTATGSNAETWAWNGTGWAQVPSAQTAPGARYGHGLAYDRAHHEVVMFGGRFDDLTPTNEMWILSESGWRSIPAPPAGDDTPWPSARVGPAMAWDPSRRRVVLVGGQSDLLEQDTWEWDGHAWAQLPVVPPPPRTSAVLVGTSDGLVLTGGLPDYENTVPIAAFADAWLLRYEGAQTGSSCRDNGDDDGDGFRGCDDPDCWLACRPSCLPGDVCTASAPSCGDLTCTGIETADLCPQDGCTRIGLCGNGECEPFGDCPGDCP